MSRVKNIVNTMYELLGRLVGRKNVLWVGKQLALANINLAPEIAIGWVGVSGILLTVIVGLVSFRFFGDDPGKWYIPAGITVGFFIMFFLAIYTFLLLRIDARKREVEEVLPDFLQLAAANVRAGMAIDRAIWFAARPEFGVLSKEIEVVAKRTFAGEPFAKCLEAMTERFDSKTLKRTVHLIIDGMASGGEVADILDMTANDIREVQMLQKEISATMQMYVIFILFASVIGAPVLYSLSTQLVSIMNYIWGNLNFTDIERMPSSFFLKPSRPKIKTEDFSTFSIAATLLTVFFASIIISTINTGEKKHGFKFMPILVVVAFLIFFVLGFVFKSMFSGMIR